MASSMSASSGQTAAISAPVSSPHPSPSLAPAMSAPAASPGTGSPCAACKFLRRKCQPDCVFAPYFPPDNPQKFVHVHRVFGASNVTKMLNEVDPMQREDAVNSLAYEADMRLRDPVYGCVGVISILQHQLRQLQLDLSRAKFELSKYQALQQAALQAASNGGTPLTDFISGAAGAANGGYFHIGGRGAPEHFALGHVMAREYNAEPTIARLGGGGGGGGAYDFQYSLTGGGGGGGAAGLAALGGQFLMRPGTAGGDERTNGV